MSALSFDIKLIVGLGNPGPKYSETRHNAGFGFVEDLASEYRERFLPEKNFTVKLRAFASEIVISGCSSPRLI